MLGFEVSWPAPFGGTSNGGPAAIQAIMRTAICVAELAPTIFKSVLLDAEAKVEQRSTTGG
jgi:hypothetical protein